MGEQSTFGIPDEFFVGEPARALDETAFDLAKGHAEVNGVADVMEDIDPPDVSHAGESVHFHFAHRGAYRKVVERFSAAGRAIVIDVRSSIKSSRAQTGPREISALKEFGERKRGGRIFRIEDEVVVENNSLGGNGAADFFREHLGRER